MTGGGEVFTTVDVATVQRQIVYDNCRVVLVDLLLCVICSACDYVNQKSVCPRIQTAWFLANSLDIDIEPCIVCSFFRTDLVEHSI